MASMHAQALDLRTYTPPIRAPHKRLIWFEESAHPPDFEEPEKLQRELIAIGDEFCREAPEPRPTLAAPLRG